MPPQRGLSNPRGGSRGDADGGHLAPNHTQLNGDNPMNERIGTHLTPEEAQEIHKGFMGTFVLYVAIALVAHGLMWAYKPWFG